MCLWWSNHQSRVFEEIISYYLQLQCCILLSPFYNLYILRLDALILLILSLIAPWCPQLILCGKRMMCKRLFVWTCTEPEAERLAVDSTASWSLLSQTGVLVSIKPAKWRKPGCVEFALQYMCLRQRMNWHKAVSQIWIREDDSFKAGHLVVKQILTQAHKVRNQPLLDLIKHTHLYQLAS